MLIFHIVSDSISGQPYVHSYLVEAINDVLGSFHKRL